MQSGPSLMRCVAWTAIGLAAITMFRNPGQAGASSRGQIETIERLQRENQSLRSEVEGWTELYNERQTSSDQQESGGPLVERAQRSFMDGDFKAAVRDARASIDHDGESHRAWRVIGAASCFLKDSAGAHEARKHVSGTELKMINLVCKKSGVEL